jgi:ribosomal protein S18 acetylase RimI-like enzyme
VHPRLPEIERYLDAVPRSAAAVEQVGPFTLFLKRDAWPYYARPTLGAQRFTVDDVRAVLARQRELDQPRALEWVHDVAPDLLAAAREAGVEVSEHPLMVLEAAPVAPATPAGTELFMVDAQDARLELIEAVADVAFGGYATLGEAVAGRTQPTIEYRRERIASGRTRRGAALLDGEPVATGAHQPVADVSEVVGIGTLPGHRRRGLGGAVTALLATDALESGIGTVFLAADEGATRVYQAVGFRRIGTSCIGDGPAE